MNVTIADDVAKRLWKAIGTEVDTISILGRHRDCQTTWRTMVEEALDGVSMDVAAAMARDIRNGAATRGMTEQAWLKRLPLDVIGAETFAHTGIDPLVATWIACHVGAFHLKDEDDEMVAYVSGDNADQSVGTTRVRIAERAMWARCELWSDDILPEVVQAAAMGRHLSEVASHPVLDRHPLRVIRMIVDVRMTIIITDHQPVAASVEQLVACAPRGCR